MQTIEYRTKDKSAWERGPWDDEPDKVQWRDETTGLPCLIVRGPHGALCGYVGVSDGHPWHRAEYDHCQMPDDEWGPEVHGGLTFSGECQEGDPAEHICHIPAPGEPDSVWWLGFDCAHAGDYTDMRHDAAWRARFPAGRDVYRDIAYVRSEVANLARQAIIAQGMETRRAETPAAPSRSDDSPVGNADAPEGGQP